MISTEQSGIELATKYQEEICKHVTFFSILQQHLTQLVKYYQQQIED